MNALEKIRPAEKILSLDIYSDLKNIILEESKSLNNLANFLPEESLFLVNKILETKGNVIFSGMGKSGAVAQKLVATFSGLGIASYFLHPAESLHGDLGKIKKDDLIIAISKSGTGQELEQIIPVLKSNGNYTCIISCSRGILNSFVDLSIVLPFEREACYLNLAPTSSTTITMAFGDALAVVVSKHKNFKKEDFAKIHPSGALGKKLLLKVNSVMVKSDYLPLLSPESNFKEFLYKITEKKLGVGIVVDQEQKLLGIITDGDLRRACELGPEVFNKKANDIMSKNPKFAYQDVMAVQALEIMENFKITSLIIINNEKKVVGLVHIHDLVKAGID